MVIVVKQVKSKAPSPKGRKATTPEAREDQLIALAIDLAEQQLRDGTASAQVISHFLKLASTKERLEKEILAEQKKLIQAKTEALESAKHAEELYAQAIQAMHIYSGEPNGDDEREQML